MWNQSHIDNLLFATHNLRPAEAGAYTAWNSLYDFYNQHLEYSQVRRQVQTNWLSPNMAFFHAAYRMMTGRKLHVSAGNVVTNYLKEDTGAALPLTSMALHEYIRGTAEDYKDSDNVYLLNLLEVPHYPIEDIRTRYAARNANATLRSCESILESSDVPFVRIFQKTYPDTNHTRTVVLFSSLKVHAVNRLFALLPIILAPQGAWAEYSKTHPGYEIAFTLGVNNTGVGEMGPILTELLWRMHEQIISTPVDNSVALTRFFDNIAVQYKTRIDLLGQELRNIENSFAVKHEDLLSISSKYNNITVHTKEQTEQITKLLDKADGNIRILNESHMLPGERELVDRAPLAVLFSSFVTDFSPDEADILYRNSSGISKNILKHCFVDADTKLKVWGVYFIDPSSGGYSQALEYGLSHYEPLFVDAIQKTLGIPNPHWYGFDCLGGYQLEIRRLLQRNDLLALFYTLMSSVQSINMADSTVLNGLLACFDPNRYEEDYDLTGKYKDIPCFQVEGREELLTIQEVMKVWHPETSDEGDDNETNDNDG